jgi:hypothetical protein
MKKGQEVWFWIDDTRSIHHHEIIGGDIFEIVWVNPVSVNRTMIYKIRTYNAFSIHLPIERLYNTKEDCIIALRDAKLNTILI